MEAGAGRAQVPSTRPQSSGNGHDGTGGAGAAAQTPARAGAKVGDGQRFDVGDYIQVADHDDFSVPTTGELTISFWVSPAVADFASSGASQYIHFLGKGQAGQYEWAFRMYDLSYADRPQSISIYHWNPSGGLGAGSRWDHPPIANGSWAHVTGRFGRVDGSSDISLFANGVRVDTDTYASYSITPTNGTTPLRIGTRSLDTWLEGRLDEVRISRVARSDAWIRASYHSENDDLIDFTP